MDEAFFKPARRSLESAELKLDLEEIRKLLPLLNTDIQDTKREALEELALLIHEIANTPYNHNEKYKLMYKIIKIGDLVDFVFSAYTEKANATALQGYGHVETVADLPLIQQIALFRISRNVSADVFALLFEEPTAEFFLDFSQLCSGKNISDVLCRMNTQKINGFRKALVRADRDLLTELLSKEAYFLEKSVYLFRKDDIDGACMSIVAAGKCALNYNICKFEGRVKISVNTNIVEFRKKLAHNLFGYGYQNISEEISDFINNRIDTVLADFKREVEIAGFTIAFENPYEEEKDESPRIFFSVNEMIK